MENVAARVRSFLVPARKAWLAAREPYGQTEAFRFYGGPIDDAKGPEGRINAWPLDEAYIDSVKGKAGSGIINNRKIPLTKAKLASLPPDHPRRFQSFETLPLFPEFNDEADRNS